MGLMKFLHTKSMENGALTGAERKFVELNDQAAVSVVPSYMTGPDGKLILGFPDFAIAQLAQSKTLYFISWSVNFRDFQKFREIGGIFANQKFQDAREGKGLIPVTIDGPYDVKGFTEQHLPCSPFKDLEEIKVGMENWGGRNQIVDEPYPLYLWRATPNEAPAKQ